MKQMKQQQWCGNNICLYCGEQGHVVHECPKKCGQHITHAIFIANP